MLYLKVQYPGIFFVPCYDNDLIWLPSFLSSLYNLFRNRLEITCDNAKSIQYLRGRSVFCHSVQSQDLTRTLHSDAKPDGVLKPEKGFDDFLHSLENVDDMKHFLKDLFQSG
jgi:hypothetical protein